MVCFGSTINRQNRSAVLRGPEAGFYRGFFIPLLWKFWLGKAYFTQVIYFPTEKSASQAISISDRYEAENLANRRKNLVAVKRKGGVIRDSRVPHAATSREWRSGGAPTND